MITGNNNRQALEAILKVPDSIMETTVSADVANAASSIRMQMHYHIAEQISEMSLEAMARKANMSSRLFLELIEFLAKDPELKDRFAAHIAAKRIHGKTDGR